MIDLNNISKVAGFGASNMDTHNLYDLSGELLWVPIPADELGYQKTHSNGPVSMEYSLGLMGIETFENYAVSGARAFGQYPLLWFLIENNLLNALSWTANIDLLHYDMNLSGQIGRFLADNEGQDLGSTMAVLDIGLRDYSKYQTVSTEFPVGEMYMVMKLVTAEIAESAQQLADSGVGTIILNTMANPKFLPKGMIMTEGQVALFDWIVAKHNQELYDTAAAMVAEGHDVQVIDVHAMMDEINNDATAFGFIAPLDLYTVHEDDIDGVFAQQIEGFDADQLAFFDNIHGTTAYHAINGAFEAKALTSNVIVADNDSDNVIGTEGDDLVLASGGDDNLVLNGGDDVAIAGLGNDTVNGGVGRDLINGGSGNDDLSGGDGADVLAGADGDDILRGGDGQDVLIGGLGNDQMFGDAGDDQFVFRQESLIGGDEESQSSIDGGTGHDTLYIALDANTRAAYDANGGGDLVALAESLGLSLTSIEEIVLVDARSDLANITSDALLADADLWGMI